MNVKLINPEECINFFKDWGNASKICYDTHTEHPEYIGKACMKCGHNSGSRGTYFKFEITDVPRFTVDQVVRAQVGVFMNVQSFRYVNKEDFKYDIPDDIKANEELLKEYEKHMRSTADLYEKIHNYIEDKGNERASEQARYVLPISTKTAFVIGFTYEALVHFMNIRLCSRSEDRIRRLAQLIRDEVVAVLPDIGPQLVPQCARLHYCPEEKGCGAYIGEKELLEIIAESKEYIYLYDDSVNGGVRACNRKLKEEEVLHEDIGEYDAYLGRAKTRAEAKAILIEGNYGIEYTQNFCDKYFPGEKE